MFRPIEWVKAEFCNWSSVNTVTCFSFSERERERERARAGVLSGQAYHKDVKLLPYDIPLPIDSG